MVLSRQAPAKNSANPMTPGLLIYLGVAAVVFMWMLRLSPGSYKSLVLINGAFWFAAGWPIFLTGYVVARVVNWMTAAKH